jgi:signal transduction histidine kinase
MDVDEVRALAVFDGTDDEQLVALLADGEERSFAPGDEVVRAGEPMLDWWVLLEGRIDLVRRTRREELLVRTMDSPGQWIGAVGAWDPHAVYFLSGRATSAGRILRIPVRALRAMSSTRFPLGDHLLEGVVTTLRRVESAINDKESLVGLGTLAAGLAHELNNPAAAVTRAVAALGDDWAAVLPALEGLTAGSPAADRFADLAALQRELAAARPEPDPVTAADLEEALSVRLSGLGVRRPWALAPVLARAGADPAWCDRAADVLDGALEPGLEWVVHTVRATRSLAEARDSAARISGLVAAVRSYSQLDRASVQPVDVHEGLESTLAVLAHRTPAGVSVVRAYGGGLPQIHAAAAELNQVWTALVENALDAIGNEGTLRLTTREDADGAVLVEIGDTGPGMPPEVRRHAFDPFFTTKPVGRGTGLGLDIARRIVERHDGEIGIDTGPGGTVIRVRLPRAGRDGAGAGPAGTLRT